MHPPRFTSPAFLLFYFLTLYSHVAGRQDNLDMPMANAIPGASTTLLDYIGRMFNSWIPSGDDFSTGERGFLGEGSSLAWGGSTLEVVVSVCIVE